ncbi:glycosyltransferase [Dyadobacter sp. 32]|uniref:glycosyltransferase n=1 Tax=Dyadobacter sp. 32 TaxID=538966 RepID=UPI0011EECC7B
MKKLNISAIVVGYNESAILKSCLQSISFCNEILYFDLGSVDDSVQIAKELGALVHHHEKVPGCEWIHAKFANSTTYEWVLIIDPDEVVDKDLELEMYRQFENGIGDNIGAIKVPCLFYYKDKRLRGTPWGGLNKRIFLIHNKRFLFTPVVHVGRKLLPGFIYLDINIETQCSHHYWMTDFNMLLEKHKRYLKNEGESRFKEGFRTSVLKIVTSPARQFYYSFVTKKGYLDSFLGVGLSIFWAWYQTAASLELFRVQRKTKSNKVI